MRIGIDIGGTFTDIVAVEESGSVHLLKILSTPDDYGLAIEEGLQSLLARAGREGSSVADIIHGTTVAAAGTVIKERGAEKAVKQRPEHPATYRSRISIRSKASPKPWLRSSNRQR